MQMSWIRGSHVFVPGKVVFSFQSRQRGVEELAPPFERLVFLQLLAFSVSQFRSGLALECPSCERGYHPTASRNPAQGPGSHVAARPPERHAQSATSQGGTFRFAEVPKEKMREYIR